MDEKAEIIPTEQNQIIETVEATPSVSVDEITKRLDKLASQERKILEREKSMKLEQESYKKQIEEQYKPYEKYKSVEQRLKDGDYTAIRELPFDHDSYLKTVLNDYNPTPETLIEKAKRELEEKFEARIKEKEIEIEKAREEYFQKERQSKDLQYKAEIKERGLKEEVRSKFPFLVAEDDFSDVVLNTMYEYYERNKKPLNLDDAFAMVNNYYEKKSQDSFEKNFGIYENLYLKKKGLADHKEKFDNFIKSIESVQSKGKPTGSVNTLNNSFTPQAAGDVKRRMTREESIEAVAKLIKSNKG